MDLEAKYQAAVKQLESRLQPHVVDQELVGLDSMPSAEVVLLRSLLIEGDRSPVTFRDINEETFQNVLKCIQTDPDSHDFVRLLAGIGFHRDIGKEAVLSVSDGRKVPEATNDMPVLLRALGVLILDGTIPRPPRSGASRKFGRDLLFLILIEHASFECDLKPTRSPNTRPARSACDALIAALRKVDVEPPSFDALRKIWNNKRLRETLTHYREFEALKAAAQTSGKEV